MRVLSRSSDTEPRPAAVERRRAGADRRSVWRGSRRDIDWIKHLEDEAAQRRDHSIRKLIRES